MSRWTDNNNDQWVTVDIAQWTTFIKAVTAVARFITKKATFYFAAVKNAFHFKSKDNNYYDITKENK